MHFTFIDIIFSIIILFFAVMACAKGFIKELFGKLAVIAGVLVSLFFCSKLSPYLEKFINSSLVCTILSFILLFITTFLLVKIVQSLIGGLFSGEILKSLDRILGFVFGLLEGLLIICVIFIIVKAQPWIDLSVVTDGSFYWSVLGKFLDKPIQSLGGILI